MSKKANNLINRYAAFLLIFFIVFAYVPQGLFKLVLDKWQTRKVVDLLWLSQHDNDVADNFLTDRALAATYQNSPRSGTLVEGTESAITSATAAAAAGTNVGSWRGTLTNDNFHWTTTGSANGVNTQFNIDEVSLNGANKMEIQTEVDLDAALAMKVQICDWVSTTSVDNAADAQCTGGGWRTINTQDATNADLGLTTTTTPVSLRWHIYDGYFTTGSTGGTAISTPLSNFISGDANSRVKIRFYSTTASGVIDVDYVHIKTFIDSIYQPASYTRLSTGGTVSGTYVNASAIGNTTTAQVAGGDDVRLTVPGPTTAGDGNISFYFSYTNVKTYTGMNTILVRAEYGCAATGVNITPRIYNFNSATWESLTSAIACSATDANAAWAKNNVTISNYISSGEIRVGWLQSATHASAFPRIDFQYIMLGTTNTDSATCEIPIGTGTATNCTNTRDLDSLSGAPNLWALAAEDESTNMGTGESNSYYPFDTDGDATASEEAAAGHIAFAVTPPANAQIIGNHYAARYSGRTAGTTAIASLGLKDYSGYNSSSAGGFLAIGATSNTTNTYTDSITAISATVYGQEINPEDYVQTARGEMRMRVRTSTDGASTDNNVINWDFAMVSLQWIEVSGQPTAPTYQNVPTSQNLVTGTDQAITSATAAAAGGTNLGSWRATFAQDNFHWSVVGTGGGVDMQLNVDGVTLNGANKMEIQTDVDLDAAVALKVQICDWVSTTSVDSAADAQCTGGGWRSLNTQDATNADLGLTTVTTPAALRWHIYDGYFTTGSTGGTAISTPLSNFISGDSNKRVKIRYYSTTASAAVDVDSLLVNAYIDTVLFPASYTRLSTGGTVSGTYVNASPVGNTTSAQVLGGDDVRLTVPGPTTAGDGNISFYFSYTNVKTYTGMNTILVRAEYGCAATGVNITPRIYNFNSSTWETLSSTTIACSATDAANAWAKNNVTISNYISSGEMRVGWLQSATHASAFPRIDYQYVMLGTTNTDSSTCEIPVGTGTTTDCSNTRDLDTLTGAPALWALTAEDESTNMGTGDSNSYYPYDIDNDAVASEEGSSGHIRFSVTPPSNAIVVGNHYAARYAGRSAGTTAVTAIGLKDYSGYHTTGTSGSFLAVGTTSSSSTQTYTDSITALSSTVYGQEINPEDYVHTGQNEMEMRVRMSTDSAAADNNVINWDFAMVSLKWIEAASTISIAGTANGNDAATVKVAVNGTTQAQSTTISGGAWTISGVTQPSANDIITVWVDGVTDANESTAVTKWSTGNITGMVLNTGVLSIGSSQNTSVSLTNLGLCDFDTGCADEDVMHTSNSSTLAVQGSTNSYTDETLSVLASNTLVVANGETVTTEKISNAGTITSTGSPTYNLSGTSGTLFTNSGTFSEATSTVNVTSASGTPTLLSAAETFHILTINSAATVINAGATITIADNSGSRLYIQAGVLNDSGNGISTSASTNNEIRIDASAVLCLGGASGANTSATCNTSAASTTARTLPSFATYTLNATSTIIYMSDAATTINSTPTYGNLTLAPLFVSTSRTYTFGGAMTINGNLNINPDESGAGTPVLTVNLNGTVTVDSTKSIALTRTNSATSVFDVRPGVVDYNVSAGSFNVGAGSTLEATSSSSVITLTGTGTVFSAQATPTSIVNAGSSTIKITNTSSTARAFDGGDKTYNIVWSDAGASIADLGINGSNTFSELKDTGTAAHNVLFARGSTQTITTWNISGTAGNVITLNSDNNSNTFNLLKSSGVVEADYLNIQHSIAGGGASWYAGSHSVDNQSVSQAGSGWIFTAAPKNITISNGATTCTGTPNFVGTASTCIVNNGDIQTLINAGTSVSFTAEAGNITVSNAITKGSGGNVTMTFYAGENITINAAITSSAGQIDLTLNSDRDANTSGYVNIAAGITSNAGDIIIGGGSGTISAGSGYSYGNSGQAVGVLITGATLDAGGGNIVINGRGYNTTTNSNHGVRITSTSTVTSSSTGNIDINGIGAGSSNSASNVGVKVDTTSIVYVPANLTITGTGGGAGTGTNNWGIHVDNSSNVRNIGSGLLTATGIRGGGDTATNYGLYLENTNSIYSTGSGDLTIIGDTVYLTSGSLSSIANLTIRPYTASTTIGVGAGSGNLALSDTYLGYLTWGASNTLTIGGTTAGSIDINTASTILNKNVTFLTGSNITLGTTALAHAGASAATLNMYAYGNITTTSAITASTSALTVNLHPDYDANASGSLSLGAGITSNGGTITILGGAGTINTTSAIENLTLNASGSTLNLGNTLNITNGLTLTAGTLTTSNNAVNAASISMGGGNLTPGSSTITLSGTGTVFSRTSGTYTAGTSTIKFTDSSSSLKTFAGGGQTYYNFWYAPGAGTGTLEVRGSNTFNDFRDNGAAAHSILFTAGTTQTVASWTVSGNAGQLITINSGDGAGSTSTSTHALTKSGEPGVSSDYLNIQHSVATGGAGWFAGANSTDNQATVSVGSGWIFTAPTYHLTINNSATTNAGTGPNWVAGLGGGNINITDIQTQLNAGTSVSFTAAGNITISNAVSKSSGGNATMSMYADGNIIVNASVTSSSGTLGMLLNADRDASSSGYVNIAAGLTSNGGNITIGGGSGTISAGSGFAYGNSGQATGVYVNGVTVAAGGGNVIVNGQGYNTTTDNNHGIRVTGASGAITTTGSGTINIKGTASGNTNSASNYGLYVDTGGIISTVDGNLTISNTTGGGAGSGANNYGVYVTGTNSTIKTTGLGNLSVTATGGNTSGSGGSNIGIRCSVTSCLQTTSTGTLTINATGGNGSGSGSANYGIWIQSSSSITGAGGAMTITSTAGASSANTNIGLFSAGTISNTGSGTINITANGAGSSNSANDHGIWVFGGVVSTVNGNLTINATASGAGTGTDNYGVYVSSTNGAIKTTGTGDISITATGGNTSGGGGNNYGVYCAITSCIQATDSGGDITINATGGNGSGSGASNYGIYVTGSINGAGGAMNITGTAGNSSGNFNTGIHVNGATALISNSASGALTLTATGRGSSNSQNDHGIYLANGGIVATVNGDLTVTGTGGGAGTGGGNQGVYAEDLNSSYKTTGSGNIIINGIRGNSSGSSYGLNLLIANAVQTTSSGSITVNTDTINLAQANDINSVANLTIKPYTASNTIGVGSGNGTLALSDTYLGYLTWGASNTLTIGGTTAGAIDINTSSTILNKNVTFLTGSNITLGTTALAHAGASAATLNMYAYGNITTTSAITASTSALTVNLHPDYDANASGSLSLGAGITSNGGTITILGGAGTINTTSSIENLTLNASGSTLNLGNTLNITNGLTLTAGTLTTSNNAVNATSISMGGGNLTPGSSTITLSGTGTVFSRTSGTYTAGTSTIKFTDSSSSLKTFAGGGQTYYNFWYAPGAGTGTLEVRGSNTFNDFRDNGTAAHSILFTAGTTQTVTTWTVSGNAGQLITINSGDGAGGTSTATHALAKANNSAVDSDYLNIQHSVVTPYGYWFGGEHSIDNNSTSTAGSGWFFLRNSTYRSGGSGNVESSATPDPGQGGGGAGGGGCTESCGGGGEGQGGGGAGGGGGDIGFFDYLRRNLLASAGSNDLSGLIPHLLGFFLAGIAVVRSRAS